MLSGMLSGAADSDNFIGFKATVTSKIVMILN